MWRSPHTPQRFEYTFWMGNVHGWGLLASESIQHGDQGRHIIRLRSGWYRLCVQHPHSVRSYTIYKQRGLKHRRTFGDGLHHTAVCPLALPSAPVIADGLPWWVQLGAWFQTSSYIYFQVQENPQDRRKISGADLPSHQAFKGVSTVTKVVGADRKVIQVLSSVVITLPPCYVVSLSYWKWETKSKTESVRLRGFFLLWISVVVYMYRSVLTIGRSELHCYITERRVIR